MFTSPFRFIYATIWILLIAYVTKYMPYGIRTTALGIIMIVFLILLAYAANKIGARIGILKALHS